MKKITVFASSTSDISPDLAKEYGIELIPDSIVFDDEVLLNNIDIDAKGFFERLKTSATLPKSAHANLDQHLRAFESARGSDEILCITSSSKMSSVVDTANMARIELESGGFPAKITIYDSLQASYGIALQVLAAARMAREGICVDEIVAVLDDIRARTVVYFVLPTLKYVQAGGRVGAIKAFTVESMGIKPVLCFEDGTVREAGFSRSMKAAEKSMVSHYAKEADYETEAIILHANHLTGAEEICRNLKELSPQTQVRIEQVGAVIGIYTGEGVIGIAFQKRR